MDVKTASDLVPWARTEGQALIVGVKGEIDLHNSPELRTEVLDLIVKHPSLRVVMDLTLVPYMDSSACAVLVEALRRVRAGGGRVFLVGLQPRVKSLLEIARLGSIFVIAADEAAALAVK